MCYSCNQNAEIAKMNRRVQNINQQHIQQPVQQASSTVGINQQLAIAAYQQRVALELQKKAGIRSPQKRFR